MKELGFKLYLLFIASWFLHLPDRISFLGTIRFDFILVIILIVLLVLSIRSDETHTDTSDTYKSLLVLMIYILVTIPFVEWPGSVIRYGIPNFIKGIVFFFFTVHFVNTEEKLKTFIWTFLIVQSFRILEPLYLHITQGYWGSAAMISNWEFMDRLSGAPHDIVNPNGLAYIVVSVIPFLYYLTAVSLKNKVIFALTIPMYLYVLVLTESRSGIIALMAVYAGIVIKSRKKTLLVSIGVLCAILFFVKLPYETKIRYLSIIDPTTVHSDTMRGRIEGMKQSFDIAMHRPIVGHGIGTNGEATWNVSRWSQISHILFGEVAIELGYVGLIIFLFFLKAIILDSIANMQLIRQREESKDLLALVNAVQVYLFMNLVFAFASYGLSSYEWYLIAGLTVVIRNLIVSECYDVSNSQVDVGGKVVIEERTS